MSSLRYILPFFLSLLLCTGAARGDSGNLSDAELKRLRDSLNQPATMFDIGIVYLQLQLTTVVTNQSVHMNIPMSLDTHVSLSEQTINFTVVVEPSVADIVPACEGLREVIRNRFLGISDKKQAWGAAVRLMERAFSHRIARTTKDGLKLARLMVPRTLLAVQSGTKTCSDRVDR